MFERDVVILDYTTQDEWPEDVRNEIEKGLESVEYNQDTMLPIGYMIDEEDDTLGWDDEGIPHNSPVYKWLVENNVDFKKAYLHVWW